jgi:hypothetical protein
MIDMKAYDRGHVFEADLRSVLKRLASAWEADCWFDNLRQQREANAD